MPINLSYPLDVEGNSQQGHYIMFTINETWPGKVIKGSSGHPDHGGGTPDRVEHAAPTADLDGRTGLTGKKFINTHLNEGSSKSTETMRSAPATAGLATRPGSTRMAQAITLYMPPSVKVSYKSNYKDDEIGALAQSVSTTGAALIEGLSSGILEGAADAALGGAAAFAADKAVRMANTAAPGAQTLAQISAGVILGSKMEVMFTDVGRRSFSFSFNFIPKSEQESRMVYKIVQAFKEHMLPNIKQV